MNEHIAKYASTLTDDRPSWEISRFETDSVSLFRSSYNMSDLMPRRALIGQLALLPLFAKRLLGQNVVTSPTYTYTQAPAGYVYAAQPTTVAPQYVPADSQVQPVYYQQAPVQAPVQQVSYDYGDGGVLAAMNAARASAGLHGLAFDGNLSAAAQGVAANCAARGALVHSNLGMENLAMAPNPSQAVPMWVNSPGHRANMFSGASRVGIGVSGRGSMYYVAAIFA
jgi:uncharacterized protein YkwD